MALQLCAAGFHLDEHALGPEQAGEFLAASRSSGSASGPRTFALDEFELCGAGLFRDAELEGRARLHHSLVTESAEESLQKSLRLALFITMNLNPAMGCRAKAQRREEEADANKQAFTHRVSANQCASLCVSAPLRDIRSSHRRI
jgi:hypothetical protein